MRTCWLPWPIAHDAGRAAVQGLGRFDVQWQAITGADNGGDVDVVDIEEGARAGTPGPVRAGIPWTMSGSLRHNVV